MIVSRRTIRRFLQRPVDLLVLEKCVNAGRLAPSGANLQPLEYLVVTEKSLCAKVFEALGWAGYLQPKWFPCEGERPTAYIVVLVADGQSPYYQRDAGFATENIVLAAEAEGLGSCVVCKIDKARLHHLFRLPQMLLVDSVIALGYKGENSVVEAMKDSVRYWRDSDQVMHVPKRSLEDIMHVNGYVMKTK